MKKKFLLVTQFVMIFAGVAIIGFVLYKSAYVLGYNKAVAKYQEEIDNTVALLENNAVSFKKETGSITQTPSPTTYPVTKTTVPETETTKVTKWGGPEVWSAVNKRRMQLGVNALSQKDELCTLASIRLNELLELGKLDGHEGFSKLPEDRSDLRWIYDKYNLSEFLVSGAESADNAVALWENTLGHKKLLTGGEYVWGCIYAQDTFAVAITAY